MKYKALHEENRLAWNQATKAHNSHKRDQAGYLRRGGSTLFPEEMALLGNISDRSLVHLQCNSGQDSLSMASLGAEVTGVDISDEAISFARSLSADSGVAATFHRSDVYDWLVEAAREPLRYDVAFASYGALAWLSDIKLWARGIADILRPGGRLILLEFHPLAMIFDEDWSLKYDYFAFGKVLTWDDGIGDYVADSGESLAPSGYLEGVQGFQNPYRAHEFQWTISEVVTAVLDAGLSLTQLTEYPYMNGCKLFQNMRESRGARMYPPQELPRLPMMFGLVATKDG